MHTDRQVKFLLNRFDNNYFKVKKYLNDLCSKSKVKDLAHKYNSNAIQIQRDRNNFIEKNIVKGLLNELKKEL
jgi:hypothetical protein